MDAVFALLGTSLTLEQFTAACSKHSATDLIKAATAHGENLITIAAQYNLVDIVRYLLDKGVYKNQPDFRGGTPLMRAALSNSLKTIDLLIDELVDPRPVSSFSGKRATQMINYAPLTDYATKFESLMKNPYFNYRYRVAEFYRTGLARIAHPNPQFYQGFPEHPLLKDIKRDDWTTKLSDIAILEDKYEAPILDTMKQLCLYCETLCSASCSCGKVRVCNTCTSSKEPLMKMYRGLHINNCKQGLFASYQ